MKVVIEDGFSKINKTGIGQYTMMIEKLSNELGYDIVQIEKPFLRSLNNKILRRILYNLWLNSIFLLKLLQIKDDVTVICTNFTIPVFRLKKVKFIPVIHDLCAFKYPECSSKMINRYEKSNIKNAVRNAEKIITVSNTVKNEIAETFGYNKEKIFVVNNSASLSKQNMQSIDFSQLESQYGITPQKYILSVATNNKRKNIQLLIDAYKNIQKNNEEIKLVLVGNNYNRNSELNKNIIITGYISDNELKTLYENALIYVFPSIYEGFGIPIIDAQSFDIPVVCSDIPVFKEVGQDSVIYSEPDTDKYAECILELLNNQNVRDSLAQKGRQNILRFEFDNIKKQLIEVINR